MNIYGLVFSKSKAAGVVLMLAGAASICTGLACVFGLLANGSFELSQCLPHLQEGAVKFAEGLGFFGLRSAMTAQNVEIAKISADVKPAPKDEPIQPGPNPAA